jgi:hypothetical protein
VTGRRAALHGNWPNAALVWAIKCDGSIHDQANNARKDATGNTDGGLVFPQHKNGRFFPSWIDAGWFLKALFGCP